MSVITPARRHNRAKKNTVSIPLISMFHQIQLPATPWAKTRPVTTSGVSAAKVVATMLAPANDADRAVAPQLLAGLEGWALGDGGYWSPALRAELAADGLDLIAPARGKAAKAAPWPPWLVQTRRRIETVLSQLTERYHAKQIRARDEWHLAARWARKFVSHTIAVLFCQRAGLSALGFAQLVRA